jgi:pyrimidine operon attenuation protein/uracil phosphoribosyltransferase
MMASERQLLGAEEIERALARIALEVIERNQGPQDLLLVGVRTRGVPLADRLADRIAALPGVERRPLVGAVDITLYRDDALMGLSDPLIGPTEIPADLAGKTVVLVDDVLYTGRTIRAALDALMDFGRPRAVRLVVLVDRGCRELPIQADFVGLTVQTQASESVRVLLAETDERECVVLWSGP